MVQTVMDIVMYSQTDKMVQVVVHTVMYLMVDMLLVDMLGQFVMA